MFSGSAFGQAWLDEADNQFPSVSIFAPEKADNGHMIIVSAKIDRTKLPKDLLAIDYHWTVLVNGVPDQQVLIWPDGTQIIFSGSKEDSITTIILDVNCLFGTKMVVKVEDKDVEVVANAAVKSPELATAAIIVGDPPAPGPGPRPGPNPPAPSPILPAGRFDLAKFAYQVIDSDTAMTPKQKVDLAIGYSKAFGGIAGQIAALPNYRNVTTIFHDTNLKSIEARAAAGVIEPEVATFRKTMDDKVYDLYAVKKVLRTAEDVADAWRELAAGFNAYATTVR